MDTDKAKSLLIEGLKPETVYSIRACAMNTLGLVSPLSKVMDVRTPEIAVCVVYRGDNQGHSSWCYAGVDAISVCVSRKIALRGIGLFCGAGTTRVCVKVYEGDNGGDSRPC